MLFSCTKRQLLTLKLMEADPAYSVTLSIVLPFFFFFTLFNTLLHCFQSCNKMS